MSVLDSLTDAFRIPHPLLNSLEYAGRMKTATEVEMRHAETSAKLHDLEQKFYKLIKSMTNLVCREVNVSLWMQGGPGCDFVLNGEQLPPILIPGGYLLTIAGPNPFT